MQRSRSGPTGGKLFAERLACVSLAPGLSVPLTVSPQRGH